MKKLLLLFVALLTGISGAWAQVGSVETGVNYYWRILDAASAKVRHIQANGTKVSSSNGMGANPGIIQLEDAGGGYYYIHETTTDKYVYTTADKVSLDYDSGAKANYKSGQVIFTGTKEETDYFKWQITNGTVTEAFSVISKANPQAYIAAMGQGNTEVNFYQKEGGYAFANVQFLKTNEPGEISAAASSITSGGTYRIFTKNNGISEGGVEDPKYYLTTGGTLSNSVESAGIFTFTATTADKFTTTGKAWKISPDGTNYFTNPNQGARNNNIRTATNSRDDWEAQVWYKNGDGLFAVRATNAVDVSTWNPGAYWTVENNGGSVDADYTTAFGDKHYVWQIEPVVTYNLKYNGSTIASKILTKELGDSEDLLPSDWDKAYCSYSFEPATIVAGTNSVDVTMTWNGPFEISTDYASATWYYMTLGGLWATYIDDDNQALSAEQQSGDAALWAFIGSPYDGVRVINKEAGDGLYLLADQSSSMINSEHPFYVYTIYTITEKTAGFTLKESGGNYFWAYNNDIAWSGSGDQPGCVFTVRSYYCQKLVDDLYAWADDNHRNELFGPSETWLSDKASQVTTMFPNMSKSTYDGITVPDDFAPVVPNYPSTGYYRIKSSGQRSIGESYIGYGSSDYGTGLRTVAAANKLSDASTVIKLTGSAGTYKLSTEGLNVQSQTAANAAFPATDAAGVDFVFSVSTPGVVTIRNAASASGDRQGYLLEGQDGTEVKGVINWNPNAEQSKWTVEAAENITVSLTAIGDYTYATLGLPFGVTLPADVKAYILTVSGEWAIPTEISEVPAGTGVLLRGTSSSVTSATLTINDAASATTTGNKLRPTYVDITGARSDGEYILGNDATDGLGFYQRKSGRKIGANKAYLKLDADLAVKGLLLRFDEETGINDVRGNKEGGTSEIFNLAGQRMSRVQKGVNIVNGKKVLVK